MIVNIKNKWIRRALVITLLPADFVLGIALDMLFAVYHAALEFVHDYPDRVVRTWNGGPKRAWKE